MTHNTTKHPATALRQTSQHLQNQTLFAHRQTVNDAARVRRVGTELTQLAELDLKLAFRQLHEMVALIGGKPRHDYHEVSRVTGTIMMQAAE
jgi:hypothetical protein